MSNLSRNIKFMRHRKGLTQKQLAEAARIAVGSMSAYEKGMEGATGGRGIPHRLRPRYYSG